MKQLHKIVFFGSGPVAEKTLKGLLPYFDFEAIITKPKPEKHRGPVVVLEFAQNHGLPVYTPKTKHELSELFKSTSFKSPCGLVVDYGIIIAPEVINSFKMGIINSHFSLLPEWRGADPITFSILSGQNKTGVSLMTINEKLDEGKLIAQENLKIKSNTTTPELTNQLIGLSNSMLIKFLPDYLNGKIKPYPQSDFTPSYSRKLSKEDSNLDTAKPAQVLEREIRAFAGWPKSHLKIFGHDAVIKKARVANSPSDGKLIIECKDNTFLEILELTAPSGKTMSGADFLRGYGKL